MLKLSSQTCFDLYSMVCVDWMVILMGIFLSNFLQVIFYASLAKSREWTYYPTELDMMQDNEYNTSNQDQNNNPDQK